MLKRILACLPSLCAGFFAALSIAPVSASAGDMASFNALGFSADGKIFAFEEYGIQDGSGFPYANRFFIDTTSDSFIKGTPVRSRIDNEEASVDDARLEAKNSTKSIISDVTLNQNVGYLAGWNAVTELSADPFRIAVNPRPVFPAIDAPLEFRLEEFVMDSPDSCALFGPRLGFRLIQTGAVPDASAKLLHEDKRVPDSRGCPLGYRLAGVQTFFPKDGKPVYAVIIAIRGGGFEGPDYRYMAVTGNF